MDLKENISGLYKLQKDDFRYTNLRNLVIPHLKEGNVLDIGCGCGHITLEALRNGHSVVAIDISSDFLELARSICEDNGYSADFRRMDVKDVRGFGRNSFDNVICLDVLEHIDEDEKILKSINYVLKDNGKFLLLVPAIKSLYGVNDIDLGHFRRYGKKDLVKKLKTTGFSISKIRYWNLLSLFPMLLFSKILKKRTYNKIRYSRKSLLSRYINRTLRFLLSFEKNIEAPIGLSIFVIATKDHGT